MSLGDARLWFKGDTYVDIPLSGIADTDNLYVEAVIYALDPGSNLRIVNTPTDSSWSFYQVNNQVYVNLYDGAHGAVVDPIQAETEHKVAFSYVEGLVTGYLDDEEDLSWTDDVGNLELNHIEIGRRDTGNYFEGYISDIRVYADDNLVGHWRLDEGGGTVAYDVSGNDNHGTIYNGIWAVDPYDEYIVSSESTIESDTTNTFSHEYNNPEDGELIVISCHAQAADIESISYGGVTPELLVASDDDWPQTYLYAISAENQPATGEVHTLLVDWSGDTTGATTFTKLQRVTSNTAEIVTASQFISHGEQDFVETEIEATSETGTLILDAVTFRNGGENVVAAPWQNQLFYGEFNPPRGAGNSWKLLQEPQTTTMGWYDADDEGRIRHVIAGITVPLSDYEPAGQWQSPPYSLEEIESVGYTNIDWDEELPDGTSVTVYTAVTPTGQSPAAEDWVEQPYVEGSQDIQSIDEGENLTENDFHTRVELETTDTEVTPSVGDMWFEIVDEIDEHLFRLEMYELNAREDLGGGRFNNVIGDLAVEYDGVAGDLVGEGGGVESFLEIFTPTDLEWVPDVEKHEKVSVNIENYVLSLSRITHNVVGDGPFPTDDERSIGLKAYWGEHNSESVDASIADIVLTLTHVDDIDP